MQMTVVLRILTSLGLSVNSFPTAYMCVSSLSSPAESVLNTLLVPLSISELNRIFLMLVHLSICTRGLVHKIRALEGKVSLSLAYALS